METNLSNEHSTRMEEGNIVENHIGKEASNLRRLELPIFSGEDLIRWVFRVERYFVVNNISEQEKLAAVAVCLEGKALNQWLEVRKSIRDWDAFKRKLLDRFQGSQIRDTYEWIMTLRQDLTVDHYKEDYKALMASLKDASKEVQQKMG